MKEDGEWGRERREIAKSRKQKGTKTARQHSRANTSLKSARSPESSQTEDGP